MFAQLQIHCTPLVWLTASLCFPAASSSTQRGTIRPAFLHTIVARNLSVTHQILEQSQSSLCQRVLASCLQAEPCRARETTNMDNQFLQLLKQPSYIQMHQVWCGKTRKKTSFFFFLSRPERRPINWERNEATGCLEWWDILPTTILQHKCYGCHMAESTRDVGLTDLHQVAEV